MSGIARKPGIPIITLEFGLVLLAAISAVQGPRATAQCLQRTLYNPAAPQPYGGFGDHVAMDGNYMVVGAPEDDVGSVDDGAAYLLNAATGEYLRPFLNPSPAAGDYFGGAVAIGGGYALVGAPGKAYGGEAYLYDAATGDLLRTFVPDVFDSYSVGSAVDIEGDNLVIAAPFGVPGKVGIFDAATGNLQNEFADPSPMENSRFGHAVDIESARLLVGDPTDGAGSAYLFDAATSGTLLRAFNNPAPINSDWFGAAVSLEGNRLLVGASYVYGYREGAAYVFDADSGALLATLKNPTMANHTDFGASVDLEGQLALVGAPSDLTGAEVAGAAYLFDLSGSLQRVFRKPEPSAGLGLGRSVTLSGNLMLIGGVGDNTMSYSGAVYIFDSQMCATPTPSATQTPALTSTTSPTPSVSPSVSPTASPSLTMSPSFTPSPSLSPSPTPTISPSPTVSMSPTPSLSPAQRCAPNQLAGVLGNPAPEVNDGFGWAIAAEGDLAVIGSGEDSPAGVKGTGQACVFNLKTGQVVATLTNPAPAPDDSFGAAVAISGELALVGAPTDDPGGVENAGSAYVFNATTGALIATLNNPLPSTADFFGYSVAISGDTAFVSAPAEGALAGIGVGVVYLFDANTGDIRQTLMNPEPELGDLFGGSVAVSESLIVVGAGYDNPDGLRDAGSVYVYDAATSMLLRGLTSPTAETFTNFGDSVAISGNLLVVGARYADVEGIEDAGTAYVVDAGAGTLISELKNPSPILNDNFGDAVAISNGLALIGVRFKDPGGMISAGEAYLFDAAAGNLVATLSHPSPSEGQEFGRSVSITSESAIVGAWQTDVGEIVDSGSAYLFACPAGGEVRDILLGRSAPRPGADHNGDGQIDIADLLFTLAP